MGFGPLRTRALGAQLLATLAALVLPVTACGQNGSRGSGGNGADGASARFTQEPSAQAVQGLPEASQSVDQSRENAIVLAARRVSPAVVSVLTLHRERYARDPFESLFFGLPPERLTSGLGSGFIIDAAGVVLTNEHVVRGADSILVTLPDGRDMQAELVGADALTDVAVLRVPGTGLPVAPLGSSEGLIIGEWAVAIGNPLANFVSNSEPSVTAGVISAVGRHIVPTSEEQGFYLGMIQTDASINPGNSGGPLVNALGQVIGVNSSIFSRSGGSEGLGFAIPIDRALRVATDLLDHGEVRRAWLGFDVEPVQADPWGRTRGVRVASVAQGSPAERAGIRTGARLLQAGGRTLTAPLDFENVLLDLRADDEIVLAIEGNTSPLRLRAEALPTVRAERVTALRSLDLITVTPAVRAERGIASEAGAMIASISPEMSAQFGLQRGDVLVRIGNVNIRSAEDAARVFQGLQGQQGILQIVVERGGAYLMRSFPWRG
jgi:serine protease Do